jgi:hypothetical protein
MAAGAPGPRLRAGPRGPPRPGRPPPRPGRLPPLSPPELRRRRRPHLTASNRRTTDFTQLLDHRRSDGTVELVYWEYRPSLGWRPVRRTATTADIEAAVGTEVLTSQDPALVPLETLPGRNHYDFPTTESPPWQWQVTPLYPGWSD